MGSKKLETHSNRSTISNWPWIINEHSLERMDRPIITFYKIYRITDHNLFFFLIKIIFNFQGLSYNISRNKEKNDIIFSIFYKEIRNLKKKIKSSHLPPRWWKTRAKELITDSMTITVRRLKFCWSDLNILKIISCILFLVFEKIRLFLNLK